MEPTSQASWRREPHQELGLEWWQTSPSHHSGLLTGAQSSVRPSSDIAGSFTPIDNCAAETVRGHVVRGSKVKTGPWSFDPELSGSKRMFGRGWLETVAEQESTP